METLPLGTQLMEDFAAEESSRPFDPALPPEPRQPFEIRAEMIRTNRAKLPKEKEVPNGTPTDGGSSPIEVDTDEEAKRLEEMNPMDTLVPGCPTLEQLLPEYRACKEHWSNKHAVEGTVEGQPLSTSDSALLASNEKASEVDAEVKDPEPSAASEPIDSKSIGQSGEKAGFCFAWLCMHAGTLIPAYDSRM